MSVILQDEKKQQLYTKFWFLLVSMIENIHDILFNLLLFCRVQGLGVVKSLISVWLVSILSKFHTWASLLTLRTVRYATGVLLICPASAAV